MGTNSQNQPARVYEQTLQYDQFSMLTSRIGQHWGNGVGFAASYVNGRIQNQTGLTYDASGNIVNSGDMISPQDFQTTTFDAAGNRTVFFSSSKGRAGSRLNMITEQRTEHGFDGDGRPVKESFGYNFYHISEQQPAMEMAVKAYQVWSTVLGSSLTEIDPAGEKLETKVFAGGALIAKQKHHESGGQNYDSIEWVTSDPVTGSEAKFFYTSEGSARSVEESEPLGQKVYPQDPAEFPEPPPNEIVSHWEDMQWQCDIPQEFYGSFQDMPTHCQIAALRNFDRPLDDLFGFTNAARENEANAQRILLLFDSPLRGYKDKRKKEPPILIDRTKETKEERAARKANAEANPGELEQPIRKSRGNLDVSIIPGFIEAEFEGNDDPTEAELDAALRILAGPKEGPDGVTWADLFYSVLDSGKPQPLWCNPEVIKQMKRAFSLTANGTRLRGEAGFMVNGSPTNFKPTKARTGNYFGKDRPGYQGNTIALFHVHSNSSSQFPSTPENNFENNELGDVGLGDRLNIDIYVIHIQGLAVYDHKTRQIILLRRGMDWAKPCN